MVILLIPAFLVWGLVSERERRADQVTQEISRTWGGRQLLNGPLLIVPVTVLRTVKRDGVMVEHKDERQAIFLPQTLKIEAALQSGMRSRGIYDVPVYQAAVKLSGAFRAPGTDLLPEARATYHFGDAILALAIASVTAIRSPITADIDGIARAIEASTGIRGLSGIHIPLPAATGRSGFAFKLEFVLNGNSEFLVTPVGHETAVSMRSDWPHPSFFGAHLPSESEIAGSGFTATWQVPHLARAVPQAFLVDTVSDTSPPRHIALQGSAFGVRFFQPINFYALVDRALKYAVLFLAIVFLCVFVMEVRSAISVHVVQYLLVGMALILFYVLLLSLSEHLGFLIAYLIAAGATTLLIAAYCASSLDSRGRGGIVFGLLATAFAVLYLFLRLEDYALVAGAVFAFTVLAIVMFTTRRIDWSGRHAPKTAA